jgi:hypothetical protein
VLIKKIIDDNKQNNNNWTWTKIIKSLTTNKYRRNNYQLANFKND